MPQPMQTADVTDELLRSFRVAPLETPASDCDLSRPQFGTMLSLRSFIFPFALCPLFVQITHAAPSPQARAACKLLKAEHPGEYADGGIDMLHLDLGIQYAEQRTAYWSLANGDNKPACMFFPSFAQDVAFAVSVLNNYTDVPWAVKGGGHNPNVGYSSTEGGVLIAMEPNMATTTLDADNLAHVGSGSRWIDVAKELDGTGRAVVTGRLGHVGVAGLTLGGGLSFLSADYGMTADTVINYEVVTASGEVVNANKDEKKDLFYALKGGGNQFAIVTEFTFETFPIGKVWGGHKIYSLDQKEALLKATHNLVSNYYDPKAAVIVTFSSTLDIFVDTLVDIFIVFFFYNAGEGPGDILSEFDAIPSLTDATKANRSYKDLIDGNSQFSIDGMRYLIRTGTLPNLPGDQGLDIYNYTFDSWYDAAQKYQFSILDNMVFSLAFQPIPHQLANASINAPSGVSLLGLDPNHGDKVFMEYDVSWLLPVTDNAAAGFITEITEPAQKYAVDKYSDTKPTNWRNGNMSKTNFNPLFLNDAMYNQDPRRFYGEGTYEKLKEIQRERDPEGLFHRRTGGFKFE